MQALDTVDDRWGKRTMRMGSAKPGAHPTAVGRRSKSAARRSTRPLGGHASREKLTGIHNSRYAARGGTERDLMSGNESSTNLASAGEPVMTLRPLFIEHPAFKPLSPYQQEYVRKGLHELNTGQNGGKFSASDKEVYAAQVLERVDALDSCIKSLRLAADFIMDLDKTHSEAVDLYRYHHENFLLRLTGIVDRAHRLVGASLGLAPERLDKIGSNKLVGSAIVSTYPDVHRALEKLSTAAALHKTDRNVVAHSGAYSSRELGLFTAVSTLKLELDEIDLSGLMENYFSKGAAGMALLIAEMVSGVDLLLDALAPVYVASI